MLEVVAAMISSGGRFLICRRPAGKTNAGMWEFPGGKVECGESNEAALAREIREELGCSIKVGGMLAEATHVYPHAAVHLMLYAAKPVSGSPLRLEHAELAWITEPEIRNYTFCPADEKLIQSMLK